VLTSSTPFEYPQVISRRFAWPILMFPQVSAFSVAGSIPSISTFQWQSISGLKGPAPIIAPSPTIIATRLSHTARSPRHPHRSQHADHKYSDCQPYDWSQSVPVNDEGEAAYRGRSSDCVLAPNR